MTIHHLRVYASDGSSRDYMEFHVRCLRAVACLAHGEPPLLIAGMGHCEAHQIAASVAAAIIHDRKLSAASATRRDDRKPGAAAFHQEAHAI